MAPPNPVPKPEAPPEGQPIPQDVLIRLYEHTVRWQHQEMLRKNYEVNKLKERVCEYHDELLKLREGEPHSAFEILVMLANDPTQPPNLRLRAAEACVQYERPKLTASINQNHNISRSDDVADRMNAAKQRRIEEERAARRIEQERLAIAPGKPIWPAEIIEGEGGPDAA